MPSAICFDLDQSKISSSGNGLTDFTKQQNIRPVQIEGICRRQNKCDSIIEICLRNGRKHFAKRRKCWFLLYPKGFLKHFFFHSQDYVVKM